MAITNRSLMQTHCRAGHEYTKQNTRTEKNGKRHCRTCESERNERAKGNGLPATNGQLGLHLEFPAKITSTNLEFKGHLDYGEWKQTLFKVVQVSDGSNWWLGACLVEGEARFGEDYAQAIDEAKISPDRAMACKYVYERVPDLIRIKELRWSHHREIAPLEKLEDRQYWITECYKNSWSVVELKRQLEEAGMRKSRQPRLEGPPDEQNGDSGDSSADIEACGCCGALPAPERVCRGCLAIIKFDTNQAVAK